MKYLFIALLFVGCGMSNEEIKKEIDYCKDNEMTFSVYKDMSGNIWKVVCDWEGK